MKNKLILLLAIIVMLPIISCSQPNNEIKIASWNLENLFDTVNDPGKRDEEFTPEGRKNWDLEKYNHKIKNLGKMIADMNPDILGVVEVEHETVLQNLIHRKLNNRNYRTAYFESPDKRGIDNGLIYDADKFSVDLIKPYEVFLDDRYPTRFVLRVDLIIKSTNSVLHLFVNHWPSRRGGEEKSRPNRMKAATVLSYAVEEITSADSNADIIIMGDFNDMPNNKSIKEVLKAEDFNCGSEAGKTRLFNLALKSFNKGEGTYLYRGAWNMLDQIIVSGNVINGGGIKYICDSFEIFKPEYAVTKSGKYKGAIIPTFGGRKYLGGYSDHYPVYAKFNIIGK